MRQLNQTGYMHNRLRMVTASFLTKDLLVDWRLGERTTWINTYGITHGGNSIELTGVNLHSTRLTYRQSMPNASCCQPANVRIFSWPT